MHRMVGKAASSGIAIGKALVLRPSSHKETNAAESSSDESARLEKAVAEAKREISAIRDKTLKQIGKKEAEIFDAHLMILEDPELLAETISRIQSEKLTAHTALQQVSQKYVSMFEGMKDEYLRERARDIREVTGRILKLLSGETAFDLSTLQEPVILVAHDLTASETATMNKENVLGFVTEVGGKTSHTAILARTAEIPAVLSLKEVTTLIKSGDLIAFNGETGEVILQPDEATLTRYKALKADFDRENAELRSYRGLESVTPDGRKVFLEANIGTLEDLSLFEKYDVEGVGLLRTEFMFMNRSVPPTEEEQFEFYKTVLSTLNPRSAVIRTLDVGGDKELSYLNIKQEVNPFMGLRAIRYCLQNKDLFRTQLRALVRASAYGNLAIMIPFITSLEEIKEAKRILEEVKQEIQAKSIRIAEKIRLGIMIEVPSAAILSDVFAKHVDFFSIGTNDLIQYVCAVDRGNEAVNSLYDPFHPGVLRLIHSVITNGKRAGIPVSMCGEMAGNTELFPLLLGMGLTKFSMSPSSLLRIRRAVRSTKYADAEKLVSPVLALSSATEVREFLQAGNR